MEDEDLLAREAGVRAGEIELTHEMIEAGVKVVRGFEPFFSISPSFERALVSEVLMAAWKAFSAGAPGRQ